MVAHHTARQLDPRAKHQLNKILFKPEAGKLHVLLLLLNLVLCYYARRYGILVELLIYVMYGPGAASSMGTNIPSQVVTLLLNSTRSLL